MEIVARQAVSENKGGELRASTNAETIARNDSLTIFPLETDAPNKIWILSADPSPDRSPGWTIV
jgi:hypothetical protein